MEKPQILRGLSLSFCAGAPVPFSNDAPDQIYKISPSQMSFLLHALQIAVGKRDPQAQPENPLASYLAGLRHGTELASQRLDHRFQAKTSEQPKSETFHSQGLGLQPNLASESFVESFHGCVGPDMIGPGAVGVKSTASDLEARTKRLFGEGV